MSKLSYVMSAILTTILFLNCNLLAYSGDGDGTTENPYQISSVEDWQQLMATPDDWGSSFILIADINLAGLTLTPVGDTGTVFIGIFDGNNHIIKNAVINQPGSDYIGLFGYVGSDCQILNLGVEDVNMAGADYIGGLVAYIDYGTLTGCHVTGSVSGDGFIGGLTGWTSGMLTGCYAACSVSGTLNYVGGLVGQNYSGGTLTDCYAAGSVSGKGRVGGLAGVNGAGSSLTGCYATASVSGTGNYVGGLAGYNDEGSISTCYAAGPVSVTGTCQDTGGLVGYTYAGNITTCYATGSVSGKVGVGGLVGFNQGPITTCYATGLVTGTDGLGGLVGIRSNTVTSCFWDMQTTGIATGLGGTGKTTAQMKTLSTFTSAGWNFVETWGIEDNQTYPFLKLTYPLGDLNHNKVVDFHDFAILAEHWLEEI